MTEFIVCSAIYYNDGTTYKHQPINISTGLVIAGLRHSNCYVVLNQLKVYDESVEIIEGFLTSRNRFLNRNAAAELHFDITEEDSELFSEDLY